MTAAASWASPAIAEADCPVETAAALDEAQKILKNGDDTQLRVALACLAEALRQTHADLSALREGRVAFSGQVYAPKGIVMTKPSDQGGR